MAHGVSRPPTPTYGCPSPTAIFHLATCIIARSGPEASHNDPPLQYELRSPLTAPFFGRLSPTPAQPKRPPTKKLFEFVFLRRGEPAQKNLVASRTPKRKS
jgi:hypothetical protein